MSLRPPTPTNASVTKTRMIGNVITTAPKYRPMIKVPDAKPQQLSFRGVLTPTTVLAEGRVGSSYPALRRPFLTLVGFQGDWLGDEDFRDSPWFHDPRGTWERWRAAGADGAIVLARTTDDIDALVEAVALL